MQLEKTAHAIIGSLSPFFEGTQPSECEAFLASNDFGRSKSFLRRAFPAKNEFEFKEGSLFFEGALALKELLWRRSACGDLRNMLLSACPMWSQYIQSTALSKSKSKWVRLD
jgi:hypothetical protein